MIPVCTLICTQALVIWVILESGDQHSQQGGLAARNVDSAHRFTVDSHVRSQSPLERTNAVEHPAILADREVVMPAADTLDENRLAEACLGLQALERM